MEPTKNTFKMKKNKKIPINQEDDVILDPESKPAVKENVLREAKTTAAQRLLAIIKRNNEKKTHPPGWSSAVRKASDQQHRPFEQEIQKKITTTEEVVVDEAVLSYAQRRRRAIMIHRHMPKLKRARQLAVKRMAKPQNIIKRSQNQARKAMRKRVAGKLGMRYSSLPPSTKMAIDKMLTKRTATIAKIANRIRPYIRQSEMKRLVSGKRASTYTRKPIMASFEFNDKQLIEIAEHAYHFYAEGKMIYVTQSSKKTNEQKLKDKLAWETHQKKYGVYTKYKPAFVPLKRTPATNHREGSMDYKSAQSFEKPNKKKKVGTPQSPADVINPSPTSPYMAESYILAPTAQQLGITMQGAFAHHPTVEMLLDTANGDEILEKNK